MPEPRYGGPTFADQLLVVDALGASPSGFRPVDDPHLDVDAEQYAGSGYGRSDPGSSPADEDVDGRVAVHRVTLPVTNRLHDLEVRANREAGVRCDAAS